MPDISKIQLENTVYDIKDVTARNSIETINNQIKNYEDLFNNTNNKFCIVGDSIAEGYRLVGWK